MKKLLFVLMLAVMGNVLAAPKSQKTKSARTTATSRISESERNEIENAVQIGMQPFVDMVTSAMKAEMNKGVSKFPIDSLFEKDYVLSNSLKKEIGKKFTDEMLKLVFSAVKPKVVVKKINYVSQNQVEVDYDIKIKNIDKVWDMVDFDEKLEKEFSIFCEVENDVNCAGLGEYWKGAGKGSKSMVCLTIGTGIGGSVILDGKLLNGIGYTAGEIGYMDVNGNHIQNIASSRYLVEKVQKEKREKEGITDAITGVDIFELAKKGDEICVTAINEIISNLSVGIRNIMYLLNPEVIVIGGGITAQKEYLEEKIRKEVNDGMISDMFRKTRIELAQQGNQAGLLGALYNFLNKNG